MSPELEVPHVISGLVDIDLIRSAVSLQVRDGAVVANPSEDVESRDDFRGS